MSNPDRLRIGHAERDAVVELLQTAAAEGRITLSELDERLESALSAKVLADLDALVTDLPVEQPSVSFGAPTSQMLPSAVPGAPPPLGMSPDDPLRISAGMGSIKREGRWELPPYVTIDAGMGTVDLDCLDAAPLASVIHIAVTPAGGTVEVTIPTGWAANTDRLASSWGTLRIKVPAVPHQGGVLLVLNGGIGMSTFRVRHPTERMLKRRNRQRDWRALE